MTELFCVCMRPDDGKFMIGCDFCPQWFHGVCVGQFRNKKNHLWKCAICSSKWTGEWIKGEKVSGGTSSSSSGKASRSFRDLSNNVNKKSDHTVSISISSSTPQTSTINNSSRNEELLDQVVNGAIQRTDVEFKVKSGPCPADLVDSVEVETENYDSNNDEDKGKALNSSSSLQKLVKSTERISGECSAERACSSGPKNSIKSGTTNAQKDTMRLKHEQAGIFSSNISLSGAVREGPTGLEVHCSMSNVSPDSSKYCINQSPSPRVQPSLAHSPQLLGGVTSTGSARASKSTPKKSSAYTCFPSNKLAPAGSADSQCKKPLENVPVGHGFVSSPLKMGSDTETNLLETNKSASAGTTYASKDTVRLKHEQPGKFPSNISLSGAARGVQLI